MNFGAYLQRTRNLMLLTGLVVTAWGCQTPLAMDEPRLPQPAIYNDQSRSIVLDAPWLRQLAQAKYEETGSLSHPARAWYYSRNTVRQTTDAGYQSATIDQSITTTFDRQSITAGRTRDHYHSTTYRRSTNRTVR